MYNENKDFGNVLKCLTSPNGILCEDEDIEYYKSLLPFFARIKPTKKRPDAFAEDGETVLLLEHFQFDNSNINRNGSIQKQKAAETKRELDRRLAVSKKNYVVTNETVERTGKNYVKNFQKQFNEHKKNIEDYKTEIQQETKQQYNRYIIGFVIEDASPFGSVYLNNYNPETIDLLYTKEFLDLFEKTLQLDFVVFALTGRNGYNKLSFISHNSINSHREQQIEVAPIDTFLFCNSICASTIIKSTSTRK